jgi:hypothetical protein
LSASVSDLAPEPASAMTTMVYPFLSVVAAFSAGLLIGVISHTRKLSGVSASERNLAG